LLPSERHLLILQVLTPEQIEAHTQLIKMVGNFTRKKDVGEAFQELLDYYRQYTIMAKQVKKAKEQRLERQKAAEPTKEASPIPPDTVFMPIPLR
jgi:hypothetical protein